MLRNTPSDPERLGVLPRQHYRIPQPVLLAAQSLSDFEGRITEFTLHSCVNARSVDGPSGEIGIAHMFEYMAFKGTETIGTKNWPAENRHAKGRTALRSL